MRGRADGSHTRRMSRIRVNGVSLSYEEHGGGDPILCIHGTGSSTVLWRDAAVKLAGRGRTIVYDRRGFGRSERPEPLVLDVHLHADDAAALLDALGASPAIVVGRSHGGEIALDLALRYPERVRALALLEGGGLAMSPAFRRWLEGFHAQLFAAAEADAGRVGEALLRGVLGDGVFEELPEPVKQTFADNSPAILAEERGGLLDVGPAELATIAQPTLLVGARDSPPAFAEVIDLVAEALPSARVEWVAGGHLIDAAHPAVLGFVDEVLARPAAVGAG